MADESPVSALIRATIEAQDPQKKSDREYGARLLMEPLQDRLSTMKREYRQERRELQADVNAKLITKAEMERQLQITRDLINAYAESLTKLLK